MRRVPPPPFGSSQLRRGNSRLGTAWDAWNVFVLVLWAVLLSIAIAGKPTGTSDGEQASWAAAPGEPP